MKGVKMLTPCCQQIRIMASKKYCIYCIKPKRTPLKPTVQPIKKKNKNAKRNNDYYKRMWESHAFKKCEECGIELLRYSATYISHIIPKGANSFLRSDPENHNLLCAICHNQWETGDRQSMKIYSRNLEIMERLKLKYYSSQAIEKCLQQIKNAA